MNPMPDQSWYNELYESNFWKNKDIRQKVNKQLQWASKLINFIEKTNIKLVRILSILEIGCGPGAIASQIAYEYKAKAYGVEPSFIARGFARKRGVFIIAENMDEMDTISYPFDMIICSHVLENIVDLNKAMDTIHRLLRNRGYLLIDTPNIFFQRSLSIYHPYCFCKESITTLLNEHGFEIIALQISGKPKSILLPKYITILAQKGNGKMIPDVKKGRWFGIKFRLSRLWVNIIRGGK